MRRLSEGSLTSKEWTQGCWKRIHQWDSDLGCFLHQLEDESLQAAVDSDNRRMKGEALSPLDGVPLGLKDVFHLPGSPTTCGSRLLEGYYPPFVSSVTQRLLDAGAILLGKLNLDEFAMGSSTEFSAYKNCRNPWDLNRTPGGSSGGCAAAVAASFVSGAIGSDTGGSVRQPAAFCGLTGLKPTNGRVSRSGLVSFAPSMDQAGVLSHSAEGCALLLQAISGKDRCDATSQDIPVPSSFLASDFSWKGLRVGIPSSVWEEEMEPEVREVLEEVIRWVRSSGATTIELPFPHYQVALQTYLVMASAEASSNLARFDGVRYGKRVQHDGDGLKDMMTRTRSEGFGAEVQRRILMGTFVLSKDAVADYYDKAQNVRHLITLDYKQAWEQCDLLLTPTTPTEAFPLGSCLDSPMSMYKSDVFTVGANLAGIPALSMPAGFSSGGLPLGVQWMAPPWQETRLLSATHSYQQDFDHHRKHPELGKISRRKVE